MERRKFHRNNIKIMIDYLKDSDIEAGYTRDISIGGMFIEMSSVPIEGTTVFLDFFLPGIKKKFKLKGKVVWANKEADDAGKSKAGIGIEFINLNDENKNYLNTGIKNIRGNHEDK